VLARASAYGKLGPQHRSGASVAADKVKPDTWNAHLDCRAHLNSFQTSLVTKWGDADARFGKIGTDRTRWEAG